MDSDSSEETSSSDYSTESSDDDGMETADINGVKLQLPQGLCERKDLLLGVFSSETWNSLSDSNKQYLQTFLPNFPDNDDEEKNRTLQKLFDCENFRFGSPLLKFHEHLKAGYFRPDISNMRKMIAKAERYEAKLRYKKHLQRLKIEVVESQKKLLDHMRSLPPGVEPKTDRIFDPNINFIAQRTKKRYFQSLSAIQSKVEDSYCSPDENYPEGPPVSLSRKQRRHLNSIKNNHAGEILVATMCTKNQHLDLEKYVTPSRNPFYITDESYKTLIAQHKRKRISRVAELEFNTKGISLSDIIARTQLPYIKNFTSNPPKHDNNKYHNSKVRKSRTREIHHHHHQVVASNSDDTDSDSFIDAVNVVNHHATPKRKNNSHRGGGKKIKLEPKSEISVVTKPVVAPPAASPPPPPPPPKPPTVLPIVPKVEKIPTAVPAAATTTPSITPAVSVIPTVAPTIPSPIAKSSVISNYPPVHISDLEGIDMMEIPIDLDHSDIDILELHTTPSKAELMQDTHSNFLSLIRDIICSTSEHRMSFKNLQERLKSWQENPISPLNDWYNLQENWLNLLKSAVSFLCGNFSELPDDFVPYMEFKAALDLYQWIGAGRDSDSLLSPLCHYWLQHRNQVVRTMKTSAPQITAAAVPKEIVIKKEEEVEVEFSDRSQTPPPPRCPTNWTVRKATVEEIKDFREQERRRYDNPHKAFTYRCNGFESVVGPLKGMYNTVSTNSKARGHTMLNANRPNFVTILSLVRDATARLPNGEGTRADICELLKCSQYISSSAPDNVLQSVVSGALDRMHTQFDPCVKYDPKRKIWIYLHRNRTEEDFERIHQQYQGVKSKKTPKKSSTPKQPKARSEKSKLPKADEDLTATVPKIANPKTAPKLKLLENLVGSSGSKQSLLISNQQFQPQVSESADDKEINEALQAIVQKRHPSPIPTNVKPMAGKSLVKIISPNQGKSIMIPQKSNESRSTPSPKQITQSQVVTQQLLQTLQAKQQQQQKLNQKVEVEKMVEVKSGQHFVPQSVPQLQSIKNVTLVRGGGVDKIASTEQIQIKTQGNLTAAQQQQILQTIKQRIMPQSQVLTPQQQQQQQILLKQKGIQGKQSQSQVVTPKIGIDVPKSVPASTPVVAKVLTNAAGQVISVESLLAHQKQHGSLPQGTTLRVSGTKGGANIIQLTGTTATKTNPIPQFAVASQNNIIISSQPKLVTASASALSATGNVAIPATTAIVNVTAAVSTGSVNTCSALRQQVPKIPTTITKFPPKLAQQLINAKLITTNQSVDKIHHQKIFLNQQNQQIKLSTPGGKNVLSKPVTLATNTNTIRMVNAANLNLTHIAGKPVLLASKGATIQNLQGQNVILQQPNSSGAPGGGGGAGLVLHNPVKSGASTTTNSPNINIVNQQNVVLGPQIKMQSPQNVVFTSAVKSNVRPQAQNITMTSNQQPQIVLEGHQVRLQTSTASSTQRVVLASQGQGGQIVAQQILLPAGFQGTAINIKALQGVKVIPIAQAHQGRGGVQGRQVFARVMSPSVVKTTPTEKTPPDPTITSSD